MTNPTTPPSLYDILTDIRSRLSNLEAEVSATRQALAKRRFNSGPAKPDVSLHTIALGMQKQLDQHYADLGTPMQLYHLARNAARKLRELGVEAREILPHMPNAHVFASGSGGTLVFPRDEWERLDLARKQHWLGITPRELREQRERDVQALQALQDSAYRESKAEKMREESAKAEKPPQPSMLSEIRAQAEKMHEAEETLSTSLIDTFDFIPPAPQSTLTTFHEADIAEGEGTSAV